MRKILTMLMAVTLAVLTAAVPVDAKPRKGELTVAGPWAVGSPEAVAFEAELESYGAKRRVMITYEDYFGVDDLTGRVTGPNPPDLIVTSQPGTLEALAPNLIDLDDYVKRSTLQRRFGDYLIDIATVDGAVLGIPVKADLKSLVWYRPDDFAAAGYQIPQTFPELVALSDRMVADGRAPWCNYIESGFATGWVGTDWVEDLLLGAEGPQVYDQWVDHSVLFVDTRIETAFERYQQMIDTPGYVFDRANMTTITFFESAVPLGDGDCLLHRQASFFAAGIQQFGYDLDDFATFKFPSVDPAYGDAVVGSGSFVAAVNDSKEARQLLRFMAGHRFGRQALAPSETGWILPNVKFKTRFYTDELTRAHAEDVRAALAAEQFRFDGSDLMPPDVGAGTFWTGIVELVSGTKAIPEVLADIDASWPS